MKIFGRYTRFIDAVIITNIFIFIIGFAKVNVYDKCGPYISWTACKFGLIPSTVFEEPWRIITSIFIHGGFSHLFMNMLALYFFGTYIERIINEKELIKIYFIGGLTGSLIYVLLAFFSPFTPLNSVVVGASGALFAVGGALAVLKPNLKVIIFPIPVPMPMWIAEALIFFFVSFFPNVAWEGHLGGLIAGILLGLHYKKKVGVQRVPEEVYFTTRHY